MQKPIDFYTVQVNVLKVEISKLLRKSRWFGSLRLFAFIAIPGVLIGFDFSMISGIVAFAAFLFFLFAVHSHININVLKKQKEILLSYYNDELESLKSWNFTRYDQGKQWDGAGHPFSKDLALFGNHSIFQMINRAHPHLGQKRLAKEVLYVNTTKEKVIAHQEAVKEISQLQDFKENFVVRSREKEINASQFSSMQSWFAFSYTIKQIKKLVSLGIIQTSIFGVVLAGVIWANVSASLLLIPFLTMVLFLAPYFKHLNALMSQSDGIAALLQQISHLLKEIESTPFASPLLKEKQAILLKKQSASSEIENLFKAFKRLEYRQNFIVGFLLNITCLWDVWSLRSIELIKVRFKGSFDDWIEVIQFFDAMLSKGQFAFNHPEAKYPLVEEEGGIHLKATLAKHPLIPPTKSVANSFEIESAGKIKLVTGANMAGKSTFLRTVGVNHILASMGMPIFAEQWSFKPMQLFTSMLTVDDLSEERSYFLAEVERLAHMVDFIAEKPDTLLIMDEILKGTNSHDKEEGSRRFIKKLMSLNATGIIATHDLNLTKMEDQYPAQLENLSFEVEHVEDQMQFDYTLRKGATKTMNALQLLKNKGLIDHL